MKHIKFILAALLSSATIFASAQEGIVTHLNFRNGELKILQITDVHYEVGNPLSKESLDRMKRVLDTEKPDVVMFTGDIVLCNEQKQGWDEVMGEVIKRRIPWTYSPGNHDDEYTWTRTQIIDYLAQKPYSLVERGSEYLKGACNYTVSVKNSKGETAALLYCMDSGNYSDIEGVKGYGWFGFNQVDWYLRTSVAFTVANHGKPLPALAFFHIPLYEYRQLSAAGNDKLIGTRMENECVGMINTGMYGAMLTAGDVMCTFVGHDHDNDYIGFLNDIGLAYGRFSGSKTTYSNLGYGARVIVLKEGERAFSTWIRDSSTGEKLHEAEYPAAIEGRRVPSVKY